MATVNATSPTCKDHLMRGILIAMFLLALPLWAQDSEPVLVGRVTKVVDGDTLDVQLQSGLIRIRLHGIDAPERSQPHGKDAAALLTRLVLHKEVQIEPFQQDRYERLIGVVYVGQKNVNAELIRLGQAWAYRRYMRKADADLCKFEEDARRAKRGLWAASTQDITAPWEWRKKKLEKVTDFLNTTAQDCIDMIGKRE